MLKNAIIWFFIFYISFTVGMIYLFGSFTPDDIYSAFLGIGFLFAITGIVAYVKFRTTYVELAETIFRVLGWQNVQCINLRKMTKRHIDELIEQGKYSLDWDPFKDTWIRPHKRESKSAMGIYYYQPKVVFKKTKNSKSKSN